MEKTRKILNISIGLNIGINQALRVPLVASAFQRWRLNQGHNEEKDRAAYPLGVYKKHAMALAALLPKGLVGADVMEIGPGGNVGVAYLLLLAGAKSVTCIDRMPWVQGVELSALYAEILATAAQDPTAYLVVPDLLRQALTDPAALVVTLAQQITYLSPMDIATATIPSASYDAIFSHACFEHFADPAGSVTQIARLLRPGGVTSHQVDLRDHRDFAHPLGHLRYTDAVWRLANSHLPNGVRNRWRITDYRAAFQQQGLTLLDLAPTRTYPLPVGIQQQVHPRFRALDPADLGITGIFLTARKRAGG